MRIGGGQAKDMQRRRQPRIPTVVRLPNGVNIPRSTRTTWRASSSSRSSATCPCSAPGGRPCPSWVNRVGFAISAFLAVSG